MTAAARILLALVVALAPLPYGSASFAWTAVWAIVAGLALLLALPARPSTRGHEPAVLVLGYVALVVVHAVVTTATWTPEALHAPVWAMARAAGVAAAGRIAVAAETPLESLGLPLAFAAAFVAAHLAIDRRHHAHWLFRVLVYSAVAYALLGIAQKTMAPDRILFEPRTAYVGLVTGPFVNRNTAATYFGIATLCAAHFAWSDFRRQWLPGYKPPAILFAEITRVMGTSVFWRTGIVALLLTALLMTASRAGVLATVVALFVQYHFTAVAAGDPATRRRRRIVEGIAALVLLVVVGQALAGRAGEDLFTDGRFAVWRATFLAVADHPWFGTGLGTFLEAFPQWRPIDLPTKGVWERAHSTPLAILSDLGIPMALLALAVWGELGRHLFQAARRHVPDARLPATGLALWVLATLHGSVDFSFEIPAVALVFAVTLGAVTRLTLPLRAAATVALPPPTAVVAPPVPARRPVAPEKVALGKVAPGKVEPEKAEPRKPAPPKARPAAAPPPAPKTPPEPEPRTPAAPKSAAKPKGAKSSKARRKSKPPTSRRGRRS